MKCIQCEKIFTRGKKTALFCCASCMARWRAANRPTKECQKCGKAFILKLKKNVFCSRSCSSSSRIFEKKEHPVVFDASAVELPPHANPIIIDWLRFGFCEIMPNGCWDWKKCLNSSGYGHINIGGIIYRANRLAISCKEGTHCRHSCDRPICVNPWHLTEGTHKENMADRYKKPCKYGRCKCGRAFHKPNSCNHCDMVRNGYDMSSFYAAKSKLQVERRKIREASKKPNTSRR